MLTSTRQLYEQNHLFIIHLCNVDQYELSQLCLKRCKIIYSPALKIIIINNYKKNRKKPKRLIIVKSENSNYTLLRES